MSDLESLIYTSSKKLLVPYYHQEKRYSCGPASFRMVLGYYGFKVPEQEIRALGYTDQCGTTRSELINVIKKYDFVPVSHSFGTLSDIVLAVNNRDPLIVDWLPTQMEGHFSVIYGYGGGFLYVHDPYVPQRHIISPRKFLKAWSYDNPNRWYVICYPNKSVDKNCV